MAFHGRDPSNIPRMLKCTEGSEQCCKLQIEVLRHGQYTATTKLTAAPMFLWLVTESSAIRDGTGG